MTLYRFYGVDSADRISGPAVERECLDDKEAIEAGRRMIDGKDIEIWQGDRLVVRLDRRDQDPEPPK